MTRVRRSYVVLGAEVGTWFAANQIRKTYLARVRGCFEQLLKGLQLPSALFRSSSSWPQTGRDLAPGQVTCLWELPARMSASMQGFSGRDSKRSLLEVGFARLCKALQSFARLRVTSAASIARPHRKPQPGTQGIRVAQVGKYQFSAEAPVAGEDAKACDFLGALMGPTAPHCQDAATEFEFVGMASEDESIVVHSAPLSVLPRRRRRLDVPRSAAIQQREELIRSASRPAYGLQSDKYFISECVA